MTDNAPNPDHGYYRLALALLQRAVLDAYQQREGAPAEKLRNEAREWLVSDGAYIAELIGLTDASRVIAWVERGCRLEVDTLTVREAAKALGLTVQATRRKAKIGDIEAFSLAASGHGAPRYHIKADALLRFIFTEF